MLVSGPAAVRTVYGPMYYGAGWMLQILAVGCWFQMLEGTVGVSLLALGRASSVMASNASRLIGALVFVPLGYWLGLWMWEPLVSWFESLAELGDPEYGSFIGMLLGFITADFVRYLVVVRLARKNGIAALRVDLTLSALIVLLSPAAYFVGAGVAELINEHISHPKIQDAVLFASQGLLVVGAWGLLFLLWSRGGRLSWRRQPAPQAAPPG
jgi:hypothetical protein